MSRGVIDQEYVDSAKRACAHAAKIGKRAVNTAIYHNPDGSRTFIWRYEPITKARECPPPSMTHDPDDFDEEVRTIIGRGGVRRKPAQGKLL